MLSRTPNTSPNGGFDEVSFKYSPLEYATYLFVRFFQGLFHASPPGAYHWSEDAETSEIYISNENPLLAATIGQRPAISTTRGPVQFYSLGFDDMLSYDPRTGTKRKSVLIPGTMTVNCCSRAPLECERLGWICAENLWLHRELLMKAGFFEIGRQPTIGSPSPAGSIVVADSGDEWYATPVSFPFQFYRTSQTSPLGAQILQEVTFNTQINTVPVPGQASDYGGPADGGGANLPVGYTCTPPAPFAPNASDVYGNTPNPGAPPPTRQVVPHPLNPAQMVVVRSSKPYAPAVRPPSMGGVPIPFSQPAVKESSGNQTSEQVTATGVFNV